MGITMGGGSSVLLWRNVGRGGETTSRWICACLRTAIAAEAWRPRWDGCTRRCTCRTGWTSQTCWSVRRRGRQRSRWPCACAAASSNVRPCTRRSSWACRGECSCSRRRTGGGAPGPCGCESTSVLSAERKSEMNERFIRTSRRERRKSRDVSCQTFRVTVTEVNSTCAVHESCG